MKCSCIAIILSKRIDIPQEVATKSNRVGVLPFAPVVFYNEECKVDVKTAEKADEAKPSIKLTSKHVGRES